MRTLPPLLLPLFLLDSFFLAPLTSGCQVPSVTESTAKEVTEEPRPVPESDPQSPPFSETQFFETKIRPVLIRHCYECHSVETESNGGLLLDSRLGWEKGGDSGPAILAGDPEKSLFLKAISYTEPHLKMPPEGKLPPAIVSDLKKWIADGAFDPRPEPQAPQLRKSNAIQVDNATDHWAYRPLNLVPNPTLPTDALGSTWIDSFLAEKWIEKGIVAAPQASARNLIRRLKFDLLGLPPTREEILEFESDPSPDAYERLVDRWIASPRFGERMARRWLDLARYAESYTLRGFVMPDAWRYRDYCIQSMNQDRPWNEVLREQIAGDLMSHGDLENRRRQQVAVTFLLMGNNNLEEQDKGQLDMDVIDEQLETMGRAVLGQTLGCARCHDHKFDPIPTRDYYALAGIFKSSTVLQHDNVSKWIEVPLAMDTEQETIMNALEREHGALQKQIKALEKKMKSPSSVKSVSMLKLKGIVIDDQEARKIGDWNPSDSVGVFVEEGYLHDGNSKQGEKTVTFEPSQLPPGNYEVRISHAPGSNRATNALVKVFSADGETQREINQHEPPPIDGLWTSLGQFRFEKDGQAYVLVSNEGANGHVIADAIQFLPLEDSNRSNSSAAAKTSPQATGSSENEVAEDGKKGVEAEMNRLKGLAKELKSKLDQRPRAMGLKGVDRPTDIPIHVRGSVHALGEVVPRGFLQLAKHSMGERNQAPKDPTRVELADWIVDRDNPLTSRVMANRIWYWMMGEGIVNTVDNFGTTGNPPSHPELLDRLSLRLVDTDWSIKQIVREIVCSDAYRRSSDATLAQGLDNDPENRLYGVGVRKRIDAETIRDALLQISGRLILDSGGNRMKPGLDNDFGYEHHEPCRSVYIPMFRNSMPDLLTSFDMADTSVGVGRRNKTTVAQQALVMLNHPFVLEQSSATADRKIRLDQPIEAVLDELALEIWGRNGTERERAAMEAHLFEENEKKTLDKASLSTLIQSMFAALDFRYVD